MALAVEHRSALEFQQPCGGQCGSSTVLRSSTLMAPNCMQKHMRALELMQAPIGTCRHIPADSLAAIMKLFKSQLLNDVDSEVLFILPKLSWPVLPDSENPKSRAKRISGNVGQAVAGQWRALVQQSMQLTKWTSADSGTDPRNSPQAAAEKLVEAVKKGRPMTKTWHQLRNGAPLCTQPEQWAEAKRLLKPHGDHPISADMRAGAPDGPTIASAHHTETQGPTWCRVGWLDARIPPAADEAQAHDNEFGPVVE